MSEILRGFALDASSLSTLVSLQKQLVDEDVRADDHAKRYLRQGWLDQWKVMVQRTLNEMHTDPRPTFVPAGAELDAKISTLAHSSDRLSAGLVLLETAVFEPYAPLHEGKDAYKRLKVNGDVRDAFLERVSKQLGFPPDKGGELGGVLKSTEKSLSHYWYKVGFGVLAGVGVGALTFGVAAPFIGGAVGGAIGLSGAAATNAGLAAIGGGSLAAGGLGMAGGTAILVGGGGLLGLGIGGVAGAYSANLTAQATLVDAAKLEVVLKEFILQGQRDPAMVQEILIAQRQSIHSLEDELDVLWIAGGDNEKRIEVLEDSIRIMRSALERNQKLVQD